MRTRTKTKELPSVLQANFLSVMLPGGQPFQLEGSHPLFPKVATAIRKKKWAEITKLALTAETLHDKSAGRVEVKKGVVYFEGKAAHSSLATYIANLANHGEDVTPVLRFMDKLMLNPIPAARNELFDFLQRAFADEKGTIPVTDDGDFIAYKSVSNNFKDCHTGTIDNTLGQVVMMPRDLVDPNRRNECSTGLHFCARSYLGNFTGDVVLAVKISPMDVVAIPQDYGHAKGRCCKYEVVAILGQKGSYRDRSGEEVNARHYIGEHGHAYMRQLVAPVVADRQSLIKMVLKHPLIKRNMRRGKLAKTTILKRTLGHLQKMWAALPPMEKVETVTVNPLKKAREAAGISLKQLASAMDITAGPLLKLEGEAHPTKEHVDRVLRAIEELTGAQSEHAKKNTAVAFPHPVRKVEFSRARGVLGAVVTSVAVADQQLTAIKARRKQRAEAAKAKDENPATLTDMNKAEEPLDFTLPEDLVDEYTTAPQDKDEYGRPVDADVEEEDEEEEED